MAGVKGKSGGTRANAGGARPGAGRPRDESKSAVGAHADPLEFLLAVMNDPEADLRARLEAAKAALPFACEKVDPGKKARKLRAAGVVVQGRFAPSKSPVSKDALWQGPI